MMKNVTLNRIITTLIVLMSVPTYLAIGWVMRGTCGLMISTEHPTAVSCLFALPPVSSNLAGQIIGYCFLAGEAFGMYLLIKRWRFRTKQQEM